MLRGNAQPSKFSEKNKVTGFEIKMVDMLLDACIGKEAEPEEPQWEATREELVESLASQFGEKEKARSAELRKPKKT